MRPFVIERANSPEVAVALALRDRGNGVGGRSKASGRNGTQYLAGGTTLVDLMKLDVAIPDRIIDINNLQESTFGSIALGRITQTSSGLRLGALVRMADAADHPMIKDGYPVIAQSLTQAASGQLRNMATLAGNVLQRTRCPYFRDVSFAACNKREPGSGCSALDGVNRMHAVLGTSRQCIAAYPGDFAQALLALDATVEILGADGLRRMPFAELHRLPGDTPDIETTLVPGEMIIAFVIPPLPWARRSLYLKVRERESFEFAVASAAVALDIADGIVRNARIALGGIASVPWRARYAEEALRGKPANPRGFEAAASAALAQARGLAGNAFKIGLGKRTIERALQTAAELPA